MTAPVIDRARLAALLGILGSKFDSEVVNAARMAERLRHKAGLTWRDIIVDVPAVSACRTTTMTTMCCMPAGGGSTC
jgi:preprotein translocase subunit SecF